jgi:acyl carrier protein
VINTSTFTGVKETLVETLGLHDREVTAETLLFGSLPELDSLALVEVITALEERFGLQMDEEDITADVFESIGSLATHIDRRLG